MTLGQRIRKIRKRRNYSIKELAAKSGISTGTLSGYERDEHEPSILNMCCIADALNVSLDYLTGRKVYRVPSEDVAQSLLKWYHKIDYYIPINERAAANCILAAAQDYHKLQKGE